MASASKKTTQTYIALLRDFESEVDNVSLHNGVTIRRLELETDTDKDSRFSFLFDPAKAFVLVYQPDGANVGNELEAFNNTITAMRLTGPGAVSFGQLLKPLTLRTVGPRFPVPPYLLTKESVDTLGTLTVRLPQVNTDSVHVAISRFNLAYDRTRLAWERDEAEDKLIDYWVALEALFLSHEQELSYRAALRISYFLGVDPDDRKVKYEVMKDSYNARSWVVHGQRKRRRGRGPQIAATEEILREALRLCVLNPGEPRIEKLDDAIVGGITYSNSMGR